MPRPRALGRTVMQGMTHTRTSSTRGVTRDASMRRYSRRGAMAIQPTGSSPSNASKPGARRRRAIRVIASRRPRPPMPCASALPSRGNMHQQPLPQLPRSTWPRQSMRPGFNGRNESAISGSATAQRDREKRCMSMAAILLRGTLSRPALVVGHVAGAPWRRFAAMRKPKQSEGQQSRDGGRSKQNTGDACVMHPKAEGREKESDAKRPESRFPEVTPWREAPTPDDFPAQHGRRHGEPPGARVRSAADHAEQQDRHERSDD